MKVKMILPMVLGFIFAVFVLPRFASMSLAAKYKKNGVAYAAEKDDDTVTHCSVSDANVASIGEAISKIKCRSRTAENN